MNGSHQKMKIPILSFEENFCILDEIDEDDAKTQAEGASQGTPSQSCSLVKPHKLGHNPGLLPQYALKQTRVFLERAGLQCPPKPAQGSQPKSK